jgi:fumarylacetoacetate (FAA) hydrolase
VRRPHRSEALDFELEIAAVIGEDGEIAGYTLFNDWSARDVQAREMTVGLGPAKGKDFATSIGPWLVTPDELADARAADAKGPDLAMTAVVRAPDGTGQRTVEVSRGTWASAHFSFGEMVARASADVRLRPGDLLGSGTVGGGCLLEVREATLGRYLEPSDEVTLTIGRLGALRTPIVTRPER